MNKKSLTLLELIVVLSIISFLFIFSLPSFVGFGNLTRLKSQVRKISAAIRWAYDLSAATGKVHKLNYDLEKGYYWISRETQKGNFEKAEDILAKKRALPENIKFIDVVTFEGKVNRGYADTMFSPKGFTEETIIHLEEVNSGQEVSIFINALTGETVTYEGYVEKE